MRFVCVVLAAVLCVAPMGAYEPSEENKAAREWFQDAKFGLFVHWGLYSVLGRGEWILQNDRMTLPEYENLALGFYPSKFDAKEWVATVKRAGMRYITITSKHHDGFAMFDSKHSEWDIVDATPYGRDVLKELAEECERQGIKLFFYHSQLDWHHPEYFPRGRTGRFTGREDAGDFNEYLDFMDAQLTELLTNYGSIGGIWFDGMWDKKDAEWRLEQTYELIHRLQPAALIGSNHHVTPFPGEDFQMFEKDLPGQNTAGFNEAGVSALPLESAQTMNRTWGYNLGDDRFKTERELIHFLVRAAGANANLLLNVGPKPDGTIEPKAVELLEKMGDWMGKYGETIYGTRGGPMPPQDWGVMTQKRDGTAYVHVLEARDDVIVVPDMGEEIASVQVWGTGEKLPVDRRSWGTVIGVPKTPAGHSLILEVAWK